MALNLELITMSSMYELFSTYTPGEDIITARAKLPLSREATFFLSTMTQIVSDIATTFNENFASFNLVAIAPSYPYIMYRAGMQILLSGDIHDEKVELNFLAIRRSCWYFSHRWLIAGWFGIILINWFVTASSTNFSLSHLPRNA